MSYQLGDGTEVIADPVIVKLDEILERQKADASSRRWTTLMALAGALFAAARLGVIAIPHIRARRAAAAATTTTNPARRARTRKARARKKRTDG